MEVFELLYALVVCIFIYLCRPYKYFSLTFFIYFQNGLKNQTSELKQSMLADSSSNGPTVRDWVWVPNNISAWKDTDEDFNNEILNHEILLL
jgi:hypothetical protein